MKPRHVIGWIIWTLVVLGIFAWIVLKSSALTPKCNPPSPPLPPMMAKATKKRGAAFPTQGSGSESLLAPKVVIPPAKTNYVVLRWSWSPDEYNWRSNIVFVVRSVSTNQFAAPNMSWPVVGTTTNLAWTNIVDRLVRCRWFAVTASNKLNHLESSWATR